MFEVSVHLSKISQLKYFKLEIFNLQILMNPGFRYDFLKCFRREK